MLGYLKLEGNRTDVDGLQPASNSDGQRNYPIHHLNHTALKSSQDPCHRAMRGSVANSNGGSLKIMSRPILTIPNGSRDGVLQE
jgi:hypothetical protein